MKFLIVEVAHDMPLERFGVMSEVAKSHGRIKWPKAKDFSVTIPKRRSKSIIPNTYPVYKFKVKPIF